MNNQIIIAISNTAAIMMSIIIIGLFIYFLQYIIAKLFTSIFGATFTNIFLNKITFIGVVHHELSHAIFAFLTGAQVVKVSLFKYNEENGSLGEVIYYSRGIFIMRWIQDFFSSIAPVVCGVASIFCMIYFIPYNAIWQYILFGFIIFSIFIHMDMSIQDIKVSLKGLPIFIIIIFCIFYFTKFNLIGYVVDWFKK